MLSYLGTSNDSMCTYFVKPFALDLTHLNPVLEGRTFCAFVPQLYAGATRERHFNLDAALDSLSHLDWEYPLTVQLLIQREDDDVFHSYLVFPPTPETLPHA
jgi:hypothetical protein